MNLDMKTYRIFKNQWKEVYSEVTKYYYVFAMYYYVLII